MFCHHTDCMDRKCEACGLPARYNILLAKSIHNQDGPMAEMPRYYLPNESARSHGEMEEVHFCADCMRKLEDALRATILGIQADNDRVKMEPVTKAARH
jgi:hypothetical protein